MSLKLGCINSYSSDTVHHNLTCGNRFHSVRREMSSVFIIVHTQVGQSKIHHLLLPVSMTVGHLIRTAATVELLDVSSSSSQFNWGDDPVPCLAQAILALVSVY